MKVIRRSVRAERDLDQIWRDVAQHDEAAATRLVERLVGTTARLAHFPLSAPARPDLGADIRSLAVGNYIVLYQALSDQIRIVRILHGARDLKAALNAEG